MFFKKKILSRTIEFYPWGEDIVDIRPYPVPASTKVPNWYKKLRPYGEDSTYSHLKPNVTLKVCVPFLDAMTAGYSVVLSHSVVVEKIDGLSSINWPWGGKILTHHEPYQIVPDLVPKGFLSLPMKWEFNYGIKLPKGYSLLVVHPINRNDLPFQTITGFVDADTYTKPINFPFFLLEDFTGVIEAGTPIAQLIPIKREPWSMKKKKYDLNLIKKIDGKFYTLVEKAYKKFFWQRKNYN
jgi:hypothetical protein